MEDSSSSYRLIDPLLFRVEYYCQAKFISLYLDRFIRKVSPFSVRLCIHVERGNETNSGNATAGQFVAHLNSRADRTATSSATISGGTALGQERQTYVDSSMLLCRRTHFNSQNGPDLHAIHSKCVRNEASLCFADLR